MRALTLLTTLGLSLVSVDALASSFTCTCMASDRTCRITWGRQNSSRNVAAGTVITRMSRQVAQISGGGQMVIYTGPFAAEDYGRRLAPNEIPSQQQVRIHGDDNLRKWRCVQEQAPPPPPPPPASVSASETLDVSTEDSMGRRPLYRAAQAGDEVLVRKMIAAGAAVRDLDTAGDSALHAAVRGHHVATVKFLIEAGADPNLVSSKDSGRTPLHVAVDARAVDMVGQLLAQGARPNEKSMWSAANSGMLELIEPQLAKGGDGQVALQVLIEKKNESALAAVLARVRPNDQVTKVAANTGDPKIIEPVLKAGGNANVVLDKAMGDKDAPLATLALANGANPGSHLGTAVVMEDQALVATMLSRGARAQDGMMSAVNTGQVGMARLLIDARASAAPPALIAVAAKRNDNPMATLLLDAGAKPDSGMAAAVGEGHAPMVRLLLDRGASGKDGAHMASAASGGHLQVVDLLLGAGGLAGPGMVPACSAGHDAVLVKLISAGGDAAGRDCIVEGVEGGHKKVVAVLLQNGAKTDWKVGRQEQTLLHVAASERFYDIAQALLQTGIDVNARDKKGRTPMHSAANTRDNEALLQLLEQAGADINAPDEKGRTPFKVASGRKNNQHFKRLNATK